MFTIMLAIVLQPLSFFCLWLIGSSQQSKTPRTASSLCDLVNSQYSPIVHVRQCLASMLHGDAPSLELIYRSRGCSSYAEWLRNFTADAIMFRRLVKTMDAWLYRKVWRVFLSSDRCPFTFIFHISGFRTYIPSRPSALIRHGVSLQPN